MLVLVVCDDTDAVKSGLYIPSVTDVFFGGFDTIPCMHMYDYEWGARQTMSSGLFAETALVLSSEPAIIKTRNELRH